MVEESTESCLEMNNNQTENWVNGTVQAVCHTWWCPFVVGIRQEVGEERCQEENPQQSD